MRREGGGSGTVAEIIRVAIRRNRDGWYVATSRDMPGLFVANPDIAAAVADTPITIKALYKARHDIDVEVREGAYRNSGNSVDLPWIALRT